MVTDAAPDNGPKAIIPRLRELIEQYRVSNAVEGKSPRTVEWYTQLLTAFLAYLDRSGLPDELWVITLSTARSYILGLQQRKRLSRYPGSAPASLSPKTVQCHVRTLKAFSSWLFREGLTSENRLANLKIPRAPSKMFDPLTPAETNKVFGCINRKTPIGMRNHAIFALMLDTGFRASEACSSQLPHLNLEKHWLKIMGKASKERMLPFGDYARADLYHYLKNGRPRLLSNRHCQAIFLNADGSPMTYNALKLMFNRLAKASGIARLHPHLCRHTFAINYLLNGGDVFSLKEILGHTTLDMVNAYLHFTTAQIAVLHHKYSPMDRLKGKLNGPDKRDASKGDF
jgi:site-specific recombinase XerD